MIQRTSFAGPDRHIQGSGSHPVRRGVLRGAPQQWTPGTGAVNPDRRESNFALIPKRRCLCGRAPERQLHHKRTGRYPCRSLFISGVRLLVALLLAWRSRWCGEISVREEGGGMTPLELLQRVFEAAGVTFPAGSSGAGSRGDCGNGSGATVLLPWRRIGMRFPRRV